MVFINFEAAEDAFGFVECFLVFIVRIAVGYDAAADLKADFVMFVNQCTDEDVAVHCAVKADIAHRAAIGAAAGWLKLFDDFLGADFWCTRD